MKYLGAIRIVEQIREWLERTPFMSFCQAITERVKGQEEVEIVALNIYNYLQCIASGRRHNNNMLIAAPSGCGKTETYRAVRDYFMEMIPELVIYQLDMTSVTEEGFKGKNTMDMVYALKQEHKGIGIAFLDEMDKKFMPSYSKDGSNVNLAVQTQCLTLIEGRVLDGKGREGIDTSNTLFIGMGAFNECRNRKAHVEKHVGFKAETERGQKHYASVSRQDMIRLGATYEFVGRFSSVINYHELEPEIVDELINRFVNEESNGIGCPVSISEKMADQLHESANGEYGCRELKNLIHQSAFKGYLEICKSGADLNSSHIYIRSLDDVKTGPFVFDRTED